MTTIGTTIFKHLNVAKHLSHYITSMLFFTADMNTNNIVFLLFVCKSHYIDCLKRVFSIDNLLSNPTFTPTTPIKDDILEITTLFWVRFAFQPEMKNCIWFQSTGHLNFFSGAKKKPLYLCAWRLLHESLFQMINI